MKITIQGQDYSTALDTTVPLTIERTLNRPSTCTLRLALPSGGGLSSPLRNQSIKVMGDDGTSYFTGYIAVTPAPIYAGLGIEGPRFLLAIEAISDEVLLDQAGTLTTKGATGETAAALLSALIKRTGQTSIAAAATDSNVAIGEFCPAPGDSWSTSAGKIADQARAAYRVIDGQLTLTSIPAATRTLGEADGTFEPMSLTLASASARGLANDVTVCGEEEAAAYVTEYFVGDGVTTQFNMAYAPFSLASSKRRIIAESFDSGVLDERLWGVLGAEKFLTVGARGLTMTGGDGTDGDVVLSWLDQIELGGTLLLEATGVALDSGSTGILAGLFNGVRTQAGCVAGFLVAAQQGTGAVSIQPIINGWGEGTSYSINPGNRYALRTRVHCSEMQRILSTYRSSGDAGVVSYGGQNIDAPAHLQLEIQEFVNGVAGMPVTLYDGAIDRLPAVCTIVAASSTNLQGSMRGLNLTSLGSAWVTTTPVNGTASTRRIGTTAEAGECQVEGAGRVVFYTGYAPPLGEKIAVSYRTRGRAVGRQIDHANQQALAQAGLPPVAAWIGSVTSPVARSSRDCRNAAQALVTAASSAGAQWRGTYESNHFVLVSDVWPGDALLLDMPSASLNAQLIVRSVKVSYTASVPDSAEYTISFANEWAEDLATKTSPAVPADAWLPATPGAEPLANLNALSITEINGSMVTINTGTAAPAGGGFEIRRRDHAFNPGEDTDLVMRGSQSTMTFARGAASERYFIRMFDGATPPNYSEFSAALIFNTPVGA